MIKKVKGAMLGYTSGGTGFGCNTARQNDDGFFEALVNDEHVLRICWQERVQASCWAARGGGDWCPA
jgi:hypothetical protein